MEAKELTDEQILANFSQGNQYQVFSPFSNVEIFRTIEKQCFRIIVKHYAITELIPTNSGEYLIRWKKRPIALSDEEYIQRYIEQP